METKLICQFKVTDIYTNDSFIMNTEIPSIGDIMNGFWVNEDNRFTKTSDNVLWIPPSRIISVEKVKYDSEN